MFYSSVTMLKFFLQTYVHDLMNIRIESSWKNALTTEFKKPYFKKLTEYVRAAYQNGTIYPAAKNIFRAFELSFFTHTKVVILGQDSYHSPGQADGLFL